MTRGTTGGRFEIERSIAPHVEAEWAEAVLLELRLQGVAGTTIAGVLTEVEAHVVDSGQDARAAFGDPVEYARALELPPNPAQDVDRGPAGVAQSATQVLGTILLLTGAFAMGAGEPADVTWGALLSVLTATLLVAAFLRGGDKVLRVLVTAPWRSARFVGLVLLGSAAVLLAVLPAVLVRDVAFQVSAAAALLAGAVLLGAATAVSLWRGRHDEDDRIVSPFAAPAPASRGARWVVELGPVVAVTLAAVAMLALGRLS